MTEALHPHTAEHRREWQLLRDDLQSEVERRWDTPGEELEAICRHALVPAGKLLRPLLCLESAVAVGGNAAQVLPAALAKEYGHVASLIHDDIIDGDDTRRGNPSIQHLFGIDRAILAGDNLLFSMFQSLAECQSRGIGADRIVQAVRAFAEMGTDMCRGATAELTLSGDITATLDSYLRMIRLKTGAATKGACQVGAILGGGSTEQVQALASYGEQFGIAFQILDDLIPYDHDSHPTDKPATSDLRNRRPTLPILLAYHAAQPRDRTLLEQMLSGSLDPDAAYNQVRDILHRTDALTAARHHARLHLENACAALTVVPVTPSRTQLTRLADDMFPTEIHTRI